jgi:gliding motility-associated protein GldM
MAQQTSQRQKMINMMYLVLTAMLALNVSNEVLKSFHLFELSFINANKNIDVKNAEIMKDLQERANNERTRLKAEKWYKLAQEAEKISAAFDHYIETVKEEIVKKGGGREEAKKGESGMTELSKPDNMEIHAQYFVDGGLGNGRKLQKRINDTREKLVALLAGVRNDSLIMTSMNKSSQLKAMDPDNQSLEKKTWVSMYLEHAPLAGVVTLLTKTQNDCKTLEAEVLSVLRSNVDITSLTPTGQMAVIIPDSRYVMSGTSFSARIALATFDNLSPQRITVNGQQIQMVNGFGQYIVPASGAGVHRMEASIESVNPLTGEVIQVKADPVQWNSFMPAATISADAMNVLFVGLENPMSISVPGITAENTIVSAGGGVTLTNKGNGKYIAQATGVSNTATVTVSARMPDGGLKKMGEMNYRVRKVPVPKLKFGSLSSGVYPKGIMMAQSSVNAVLEDFYFNNVRYTVRKYKASMISKREGYLEEWGKSNDAAPLKRLVSKAQPGEVIFIESVEAEGPGGVRNLEPISLKIK